MDAQGAVDSLLGTLASVIRDEAQLLGNVRGDVQFIKDEMESMNGFLLHVNKASGDDDHQVRAWMKQVRDVAMESERWVDRYLQWVGTAPPGGGILGYARRIPHFVLTMSERHEIAAKIQELKARAYEVGERRQRYGVEVPCKKEGPVEEVLLFGGDETETGTEEQQYARRRCLEDLREPDNITQEDQRTLIQWLTEEDGDRVRPGPTLMMVIRIGGAGKANLWDNVIRVDSVATRFDRISWITVHGGEVDDPRPKGMLLDQLISDLERQDAVPVPHDVPPQQKLSAHLQGRRFLIVFDGMDNPAEWSDLHALISTCGGSAGSAVIVINPGESFPDVSDYAIDKHGHTKALNKTIVGKLVGNDIPRDHRDLLHEIMVKLSPDYFCSRMFLHLLFVNPKVPVPQLHSLSESLLPESAFWNHNTRQENTRQMLLFSYNDLPNDYKPCLLYLSIFPRGWRIRRTSLVRRWVAEGLITRRAGPDAAERYLTALLDRGLLLPFPPNGAHEAKSVEVHADVLHFIVETARAHNFADLNLPPNLAPHLSINNGIQLQWVHRRRRRDACLGSILCNRKHGVPYGTPLSIQALLASLPAFERQGLLKVIDLESCPSLQKQHLKNVCQLSEIRFLNLRGTDITSLPKQITGLQNLETLDIRNTKVTKLPKQTIFLRRIKHILSGYIEYSEPTNVGPGSNPMDTNQVFSAVSIPNGIGYMTDMEILSHVKVSHIDSEKLIDDFERLKKLRKLGVVLRGKAEPQLNNVLRAVEKLNKSLRSLSIQFKAHGENDSTSGINNIIKLPDILESIKMSGFRDGLPSWALKPNQLVKVTLQETFLTKDDLRSLGKLARLCFLRLQFIYLGEESNDANLEMGRDEFPNLKVLVLERTNMVNLSLVDGAAPKLEKMYWFRHLVKSVSGIEYPGRLREIGFHNCIVEPAVPYAIWTEAKSSANVYYDNTSEADQQISQAP